MFLFLVMQIWESTVTVTLKIITIILMLLRLIIIMITIIHHNIEGQTLWDVPSSIWEGIWRRGGHYWDFPLDLISAFYDPGGEIQEAEVYLPIVAHKYTMDLSNSLIFPSRIPARCGGMHETHRGNRALCMTVIIVHVKNVFVVIIDGRVSSRWVPTPQQLVYQ